MHALKETDTIPAPGVSPDEGIGYFIRKVMDYRVAKVLLVATDLGLFTKLAKRPLTAVELAAALGADRRATTILADALVATRLLTKVAGRYANTPVGDRFLVEGRPDYKGNNLRYQEQIWAFWSQLGEVVRTGRPVRTLADLLSGSSPEFQTSYIRGMHDIAREPARVVAQRLAARPFTRILDVGGGPGTYTMALLEAMPGATADILDLPSTLDVTRQVAGASAVSDRIRFIEGDYLANALPSGYDLVLLSHVTHDESPDENLRLVCKASLALRPGGRVAIHDFVLDESRTSPAFSALFSVNMLVYTAGGQTYTTSEYRTWLTEAGLIDIQAHDVLLGVAENASALIVGTRPGA